MNVVIIGGGPAGSTLGILCRRFGLEVLLLEAAPQRYSPGEALPVGIGEYFKHLGVADKLTGPERIRYTGLNFQWGERKRDWESDADLGFRQDGIQVPRDLLDRTLLERAREVGVQVLQPCVARGLVAHQGRICGVQSSKGDFLADFVVDASGHRHWLAKKLRLAMQFFSPELYGYFGWAEGSCPERDEFPLIISTEDGWQFTSRVDQNLYQFSKMSFQQLDLPSDWLPDDFKKCGMRPVLPLADATEPRPAGKLRGADVTWRRVFQPAGPGFFICGDAIARNDPVAQQGVAKCIQSSFRCALALNAIYHNGVPEEEARGAYIDWSTSVYVRDLTWTRDHYREHPRAPEWLRDMTTIQGRFVS